MLKRGIAIAAGLLSTGFAASDALAQDAIVLADGGRQGMLVRTDSPSAPSTVYATMFKGLEDDESILSIGTAQGLVGFYGLTEKRLYAIDQTNGQVTAVGPRFASTSFATYRVPDLEIDPVSGVGFILGPDRFSDGVTGIVATIATDTGRLTEIRDEQGDLPEFAYAPGDVAEGATANVRAIACAGDVPGENARTMFGLDGARRTLVRIGSAGGLSSATDDRTVVHTVAAITGLPDDAHLVALDVGVDGVAWLGVQSYAGLTMQMVGAYRLDLTTGVASLHRDNGLGGLIRDISSLSALLPEAPLPLDVKKAVVRYDFRPGRDDRGSITIKGTVPYPADGGRNAKVSVDVDGVVREFVTDAKGRAVSGRDEFRFVGKLTAGRLRFELTIRRTDVAEVAGVVASTPTRPTQMNVDLFLEGRAYRTLLDIDYFAGRGRGTAKTP
jgi:hypothetical protein